MSTDVLGFGPCEYCRRPLRLFLDPRLPFPRPNIRCDCEASQHALQVLHDPEGRIWPESRQWLLAHGFEIPHYEFDQVVDDQADDAGEAA